MMMMGVLGTLLAREDMWQETCGVVVEQCGRCMLMRKREHGWEQTGMTMASWGRGTGMETWGNLILKMRMSNVKGTGE